MGRRKIEIQPIVHDRNRSVTFLKRKNGLFKKAYELGVLCSVDVCVVIFGHNGKLHEYCSGDAQSILERRFKHTGDSDLKKPSDFAGGKSGGGDDDDDGDSGAEDLIPQKRAKTSPKSTLADLARQSSSNSVSFTPPGNASGAADDASLPRRPASRALSNGGNAGRTSSPLGPQSNQSHNPLSQYPPQHHIPDISQHHQQLAQQFLVQHLQNINPNLNSGGNPSSIDSSGNNAGLNHPSLQQIAAAAAAAAAQGGNLSSLTQLGLDALQLSRAAGVPPRGNNLDSVLPFLQSAASSLGSNAGGANSSGYSADFLALLTAGTRPQPSLPQGSNSNQFAFNNLGSSSGGFEWPDKQPVATNGHSINRAQSATPSLSLSSGNTSDGSRNPPFPTSSGDSGGPRADMGRSTWLDLLTAVGANSHTNTGTSNRNGPSALDFIWASVQPNQGLGNGSPPHSLGGSQHGGTAGGSDIGGDSSKKDDDNSRGGRGSLELIVNPDSSSSRNHDLEAGMRFLP